MTSRGPANIFHYKCASRRVTFQFSLRTLLLATTLLAILLSGITSDWWQGLSRTDYDVLSVAVRPYLEQAAPDICILFNNTEPLSETKRHFIHEDTNLGELASLIPELGRDTLRSLIRNNGKAYAIRRELREPLKYALAGTHDNELDVLLSVQCKIHVLYVSRPGIDRAGRQAVVYVKECNRNIEAMDWGQLVILNREQANWRITRTVDVFNFWIVESKKKREQDKRSKSENGRVGLENREKRVESRGGAVA